MTLIMFNSGCKATGAVQLVVPLAIVAIPLTLTVTWLTPLAFGVGSSAIPENRMLWLVTVCPLNGLMTDTIGAMVSNCPPGVMCKTNEPSEFELTLATAMRYVTLAWALKLT